MTETNPNSEPPIRAAIVPVTPLQQNCSLVWCIETNKGAFIDPGGDIDRLLAAARETGCEIEKIMLTHGHADHAGAADELRERLGVPIEGPHIDDKFWIKDIPTSSAKYGFPGGRAFESDRWLEGGDTVSLGNVTFDVYHCPGHTPGHVVFHQPESSVAFVGDVLFQGSIGRTDFPKGDHDQLINSITTQLWPLGDDTAFVPGHGPMSTFGQERKTNPYVGGT
ncbi:MBL fold metallo-hydrolase [Thalassospiraceae bacterium LMO-JJ14]|nr:MBL fold metallo-hydrolase [Thalassospiraceae bacterium LMO-JJ14]